MEKNNNSPTGKENSMVLYHWSARKMHPSILVYVGVVYLVFIVVAYFGVHSIPAVQALAIAAVGTIGPLIPGVLKRIDYRLTEQMLEQRPQNQKDSQAYQVVFRLNQVDYLVKVRHGFKFYFPIAESNSFKRFWKKHVSDEYSGEVHIESKDIKKVITVLTDNGIPYR